MELRKSFFFTSQRVTLQSCNIHDVFRNSIPFPSFEVTAIPDRIFFPLVHFKTVVIPLLTILILILKRSFYQPEELHAVEENLFVFTVTSQFVSFLHPVRLNIQCVCVCVCG